jgi:Rrf2 family transcriptional regulator, nitric oxide-sensitive transcriptional repressor
MRLTSFTDYGLRVLMFLAAQPGRRATIAEIATAYGISENHLMKVVHCLGRAGFLRNVRGRGGGLELARAPAHINVGDVVRATEGPSLPAECFDRESNGCRIVKGCGLPAVLDEAVRAFYAALARYTLADVSRNQGALRRLLFIPDAANTHHERRA